jgi:hypothetical protein
MRLVTLVALAAVLGFCDRANAQYVVGTGGTSSAGLGYYSPTPGVLYSPFRPAPAIPTYNAGYGNYQFGGAPQYYNNGYTVTRTYSTLAPGPHYGYGGYNTMRGYRRW